MKKHIAIGVGVAVFTAVLLAAQDAYAFCPWICDDCWLLC